MRVDYYTSAKQTTAPTAPAVRVEDAVEHLRLDDDSERSYLTSLISAATTMAETMTRRQFCTATWQLKLDDFSWNGGLELPRPPLSSVTSITYTDNDGDTETVSSATYTADTARTPGRITLAYQQSWPTDVRGIENAVTVTYVAGYGSTQQVPQAVKNAILLIVGHLYENREDVTAGVNVVAIPQGAKWLLGPYTLPMVA